MKKLTEFIAESNRISTKSDVTLSYVSKKELNDYLNIAARLISPETKLIVNYLIESSIDNDDLLAVLMDKITGENEISTAYKKLKKYNRLKEIPIYMTREELDKILKGECTVDELLLDFDSDRGKNDICKRYEGLVYKIAKSYLGVSNLDMDELLSAGWNGLNHAINKYGRQDKVATDENGRKNWISFSAYAATQIRFYILEDIKKFSHTVAIPTNVQYTERAETGSNTKSYTVSGDEIVGDSTKTRFETIGGTTEDDREVNFDDADVIFSKLISRLKQKFNNERNINIFIDAYGFDKDENGDPMKDKAIAAKYGISCSNVTYIKKTFIEFIKSDKECMDYCEELMAMYESNTGIIYKGRPIYESTLKYNYVIVRK